MICPSCGTENKTGAKFCGGCAAPLAHACPACGAINDPGMRFCNDCASPLSGAPPVKDVAAAAAFVPVTAVAERRLVSVLFADLVGFTTLSESRDAEEVRELLSRYFDTCRRLIELYGGTVEKFIGDAVMAVWGAPTATEDDAERAVRAALDLVASVTALGDEVAASDLRARAGVLTGEAAVTLGATGEGMVAGDLVNTASRVQSVADGGSVYVGEATRRATEQTIVFAEAGSFELKGKEGLVPLWKALRVVSGVRGTLKSQGLEAPFVGRDRELRQIKDFFHTSADEQKAHLVSVTGIAGIGKSRLAWEFYKYFDGITQTIYWHRGRCLAYGEGVTYWALADMVRMRCRIAEDEDPASALGKLRLTLDEHLLDPEERRYVEPRLAQLLGLGEHEGRDRQDLFAAWRLFFERLADQYPTVLAFEDMQWADASLLDFVEYLLEWSRDHPLYVITLARPELLERRPTWGAGHRNFTSLYLEPLSVEAMKQLLRGLVPGLPEALTGQILARAEGVPLYAVETVRMLLDRELLVQEGSVYRPVGEIGLLEVPETLHALIAARLDGLTAPERHLLQDGAVLGKTFTQDGLAALSDDVEPDHEPLLGALVRKEVLSRQADPRSPEHGQYGFLQDLVRHVAYETLSKRDRRAKHLAAAAFLSASLADDEVVEVLAAHYLSAYRAAPEAPDALEIKERAREALAQAGERAASLAAAAEAQRYFEQAAELSEDKLVHAALTDRAGQMAWRAGEPVEARALLNHAHDAYEAEDEIRPAARVSARLAELDFLEGHAQQAVARLEPALEALTGEEPDEVVAVLAGQLGRFLVLSDDGDRAVPILEQALQLAETLGLPETLAEALTSKAINLLRDDRLYEARVLLEAAVSLALEHDLHAAALRGLNNLAVALGSADRVRESLATVERGLELARRVGDRGWESSFLAFGVGVLTDLDRWDEALARSAEVEELENVSFVQAFFLITVRIHGERGDIDLARDVLARNSVVGQSEAGQDVAHYALAEARLLRAEGRPADALETAQRAIAMRSELGITFYPVKFGLFEALEAALALQDTGKARELLTIVDALRPGQLTPLLRAQQARFRARLAAVNREADVASDFVTAETILGDLDMPFRLAVAQLEHAEWLTRSGQGAEAEPLLSAAREAFERLQARPWLERLRGVETGQRTVLTESP
jgi:class 3 adenylate cyclase